MILIRHGESLWNKKNIFTGWIDIKLSKKGKKEAENAGNLLKKKNILFDYAYTSVLKRSIHTLWKILNITNLQWINVFKTWKLNERHYGLLQGLNKEETAKKYGEKQVLEWRRSFKTSPPKINIENNNHIKKEHKYKNLKTKQIPTGESLLDTYNRVIPFWKKKIIKKIKNKKNIIIVAHGNSLRALIKHIEKISDENIININVPTGIPIIYELDEKTNIKKKYLLY